MNIKTKHIIGKIWSILMPIGLIAIAIGLLCYTFLPKKDNTPKENYEFFHGGVRFDYINNIRDTDMMDCKWVELYCQSDGSLSGGKYYDLVYKKDIITSYNWYDIESFTLNGREITIYFDKKVYDPVHGVFNDDWTSITFSDAFPPIYDYRYFGRRFDISEKA